MVEKAGWTGFALGAIATALMFLLLVTGSAALADGGVPERRVKLHSPCTEDEFLQVVKMREVRRDVYRCKHVDNL